MMVASHFSVTERMEVVCLMMLQTTFSYNSVLRLPKGLPRLLPPSLLVPWRLQTAAELGAVLPGAMDDQHGTEMEMEGNQALAQNLMVSRVFKWIEMVTASRACYTSSSQFPYCG